MTGLVIAAVFGLCCALIASNRGRSPVGWFLIGSFFCPFGLILLVVLPDLRVQEEREHRLRTENRRLRERVKKERQVADQRHREHGERLGAHDRALGIDTVSRIPEPAGSLTLGPPAIPPDGPTDYGELEWFYVRNGSKVGPVSLDDLQTCWRHGLVASGTLVWNRDLEEWTQVCDLKDLEERLVE